MAVWRYDVGIRRELLITHSLSTRQFSNHTSAPSRTRWVTSTSAFALVALPLLTIAAAAQATGSSSMWPRTRAHPVRLIFSGSQSVGSRAGSLYGKRPFRADDRITVTAPDKSVKLAQPVQIVVHMAIPHPAGIFVAEHQSGNSFDNQSNGRTVGSCEAKLIRDSGLEKTIEITPLQVGVLDLEVMTIFSDGGLARKTCHLNVLPAAEGLKHFYIDHGGHVATIVLEDKEDQRQIWLAPEVYYKQLDYPIHLTDSSLLSLSVQQPGDPVIKVDPNGLVHGLRPGQAKLTAKFDGVEDSVVITVYSKENAPIWLRRLQ
jgi:hypothetical protein